MRTIEKYQTVFDSSGIDPWHVYAGYDYGGYLCVAMARDDDKEKYKMIACVGAVGGGVPGPHAAARFTQGSGYQYDDVASVKRRLGDRLRDRDGALCPQQEEDCSSLEGTLRRFSEAHDSNIYEFDTFAEFCGWIPEHLFSEKHFFL